METLPNCFWRNLQSFRETIVGPVSFQTLPPTVAINSLATRTLKWINRCISTRLEISISVCFTTIINDRKGIKKSSKRPDQHDHCYVRLAGPVIVTNPVEDGYWKSNSLTKSSKGFTQSRRENSSSNSELVTETGSIARVRQNISSKGIYKGAIDHISNAQRIGYLLIKNRPGQSGLAGFIESKLLPLVTIQDKYWISLQKCLHQNLNIVL